MRWGLEYVAMFLNYTPKERDVVVSSRWNYYFNEICRIRPAGEWVASGGRIESPGVRLEMGWPLGGALDLSVAFVDVPAGAFLTVALALAGPFFVVALCCLGSLLDCLAFSRHSWVGLGYLP